MDIPAMAVGGSTPVMPLAMLLFLVVSLAGGLMLVSALLWRNFKLVRDKGFHPFNPADLQKAADPGFSTRPPGSAPFQSSLYARIAFLLLGGGLSGLVGMLLWALFTA